MLRDVSRPFEEKFDDEHPWLFGNIEVASLSRRMAGKWYLLKLCGTLIAAFEWKSKLHFSSVGWLEKYRVDLSAANWTSRLSRHVTPLNDISSPPSIIHQIRFSIYASEVIIGWSSALEIGKSPRGKGSVSQAVSRSLKALRWELSKTSSSQSNRLTFRWHWEQQTTLVTRLKRWRGVDLSQECCSANNKED